jgi:hypothetical protein
MHAKYFLIDECAYGHDIEYIRKGFPEFDVVFSFTLIYAKVH